MRILAALCLLCAVTLAAEDKRKAPDTILVNGDIYTGEVVRVPASNVKGGVLSEVRRRVQALAFRNGRIVAAGSTSDIQRLATSQTRRIDLRSRFVMPGFNDAHIHLASGGLAKLAVDLIGTKSLEEMKSRVAQRATQPPAGEWLTGRGWDHTLWKDQTLPSRQDLDAVTGDHPAFFRRVDGHIGVANTAALRLAGITRETPDPQGGKIDRDAGGEATGILRDTAMEAFEGKIPPPTPAQRRRGIKLALAEAARFGVTSAQDILGSWEDFLVYEDLQREGKLTVRITAWMDFNWPLDLLQTRRARRKSDDRMLRVGPLKGYMDGSLGSRTAALLAPYSDDPNNSGLARIEQDKLNQMTIERTRAGFQIGFHAIGDRAAQLALDAFAQARRDWQQRNPGKTPDLRPRIEHCQVITAEQPARFAVGGVVASVQPNHLLTDMRWAEQRIGTERARYSYPWYHFEAHAVALAFGTDYPVEPITPFRGLYAAVTRMDEAGKSSYHPEQKLSMDSAIEAYTAGAAYAEFMEKEVGTLAPGMLADFVVLDRDITKVPLAEILRTKVLQTWVGGKKVYDAEAPLATSD